MCARAVGSGDCGFAGVVAEMMAKIAILSITTPKTPPSAIDGHLSDLWRLVEAMERTIRGLAPVSNLELVVKSMKSGRKNENRRT